MQNKLFLKAADVCELLEVSTTFAYEIIANLNSELEKQKSGKGISFSSRRRALTSSLVISLSSITKIWKSGCVKIPCTQNVILSI